MRSNESAFFGLTPVQGNAERRDYPMRSGSIILSMTDMVLYPPYAADQSHRHNCMEIGVCLAGRGRISMDGHASTPFEEGTVIIVPEGVHHAQINENASVVRWRYIAVDQRRMIGEAMPSCREKLRGLLHQGSGIFLSVESMRSDVAWLIGRMFDIKCRTAQEATAELEAILQVILMRICREEEIDDVLAEPHASVKSPVEPALLFIAEQYQNEIRMSQLARSCAMSESHFRKVFQEHLGVAPGEYLNRYRIERAVRMIRTQESIPVSRVAEACGFASIATFNRNFVRFAGKTPMQVRQDNKNFHGNGE